MDRTTQTQRRRSSKPQLSRLTRWPVTSGRGRLAIDSIRRPEVGGHLRSRSAPLGPAAVLLELEAAGLELHAGDGRVRAELLEGPGAELPGERGARLRDGRDPVLEDERELDAGVADLLVERFPQQAQEGRQLGVRGMEQPGHLAHEGADLRVERIA